MCRILGRIIALDTAFHTSDTSNPCFKAPCRAKVHIDTLYGCNMGFPSGVYAGEDLVMTFMYTLSPSKEIFPGMKESYPGLQVGSLFVANVEGHPVPIQYSTANNGIEYSVYGYSVRQ
jgi:hypothetical protein